MLVVSDVWPLYLFFCETLSIRYEDDGGVVMGIGGIGGQKIIVWARECLGCVASSTHPGRDIGD